MLGEKTMSYKYSKGSQVIGDLKAADDAQRDTKIDFGEDQIDFHTSGSMKMQIANHGITTTLPIHISGSAVEGLRLAKGSSDYRAIVFEVNGVDNANISVSSAENFVIQNEMNGKDIQFWVNPNVGSSVQAMTIKESGLIGINTSTPISNLDVSGKIAITSESSTPSQPADGQGYLYTKSDGKIYWRSYDVPETDLTAIGGGGGGSSLTVQDEGSSLSTSATTLNFVGSGVVASGTGATKTITIAGGGGGSEIKSFNTLNASNGEVVHDCTNSHVFYHTNIAGNFSPNFTQLSISNNQTTETTVILNQGGTAYSIESVKVNGTDASLFWEGARPDPSINTPDIARFQILRSSNAYTAIGNFTKTVSGAGFAIPNNAVLFLDASDAASYGGSGTSWNDLSGLNNHATLVNSPSYNSGTKLFEFTGNSQQHITVPSGFADFASGITCFVVADLGAGSNWERFFDFSVGGQTNDAFNFGRNGAGTHLNFQLYHTDPGNHNRSLASNQISNNTLCSYAVTADGTNAKVYKNGSLVDTVSFTGALSNVTRTQNYIGRSRAGNNAYYEGDIAVAAIFSRALSDSEITEMHNHYNSIYNL
tara:strand:+ start:8423 stop:10201 length:1779 start_codon:yes stop_codon:yes gene_type:complete